MNISGVEIEVIKKTIKNMHLYVLPPDGRVRISAPKSIGDETIRLFAISKIAWIKNQREKYQNQSRQSEREFVSGESHYFWGKRYRMEIRHTRGNSKIDLQGNKLILTVHPDSTSEQRAATMNEWYRKQLRSKLPALFNDWQKLIGVYANEVKIKNMLTKWGACNVNAGRIWINLQLAKKPPECLEYVVVHELVHLREKSHNSQFVSIIDEYLADWRQRKEKLNNFIMDQYISSNDYL